MEKSIENLWKEGFLSLGPLAAPKVNDLYRKKSLLLTARMRKTMKWDIYLALPMGVIFLFGFGIKVHWGLGVYAFMICLALFLVGLNTLRKQSPDFPVDADVYRYLKDYRERIRVKIKKWTRRFAWGTPLVVLPAYYFLFFILSDKGYSILEREHGWIALVVLILIISAFLSVWGVISYRFGVGAVYGRLLKRIDRTLADMEELSE